MSSEAPERFSPRWWVSDREGRLALVFFPIPALAVWMFCTVIGWTHVPDGGRSETVAAIGKGALVVWALDEVVRGASPARRVLGAVVLGAVVLGSSIGSSPERPLSESPYAGLMAAWRSPSTSHEVASDGSPAPREWWRSRPWLLVAAAVVVSLLVGLMVGLLVGASTVSTGRAEGKPAPKAPVAAGVLTEAVEGSPGGWDFELPVFNATTGPVDVSLVSMEGAKFGLTSGDETDLAPGTWGTVPFSVVANCDVASPGALTSARLRVRSQDGSSVAAPPLPDRGSAVRGYHRAVCASADPIPSTELVGVWTVEKVYGPETWLVGTRQIRFERDGSFVVDRRGGLSSDGVGARGRYRLEGELLTVGVYRSDGCQAPSTATWRVTVRNDQMSMVWIHGVCPGGDPGDAWVLRRTLQDAGTPEAQN